MVGLQNTAVLKLKIELDSKDINGTKKLLTDLTNAFKAQSAAKGINAMEKSLVDMRQELQRVKGELSGFKKASDAAYRGGATGAKQQARADEYLTKVIASLKGVQLGATQAANKAAMQARITAAQEKNRAIALQQLQSVMAGTIAISKAQQAVAARAASQAAQAARERVATEKNVTAVLRARAVGEKALADAQKLGVGFQKRNKQLIDSLTAAMRGNLAQLVQNTKAINTYASSLSKLGAAQQLRGFIGQLTAQLSHYEQQLDALFRASFRLSIVGSTLRRFGQDILRVGSDIMKAFGDFEYSMIRAAGTLSIWFDSAKEGNLGFKDLQAGILALSNEMLLFPAKDVAEALYFWGSATGQVVEKQEDLTIATEALDAIMKAAILTNTDYETTIKGVYSILTQFYGGALEYADEVTEQLFYTTQRTAAEFGDLVQSFKMVGPVAAQMGVQFSEINEIFGELADLGIRGSQAGRGLRQLFIQTLRPSGPATEAINEAFASPHAQEAFGGMTYKDLVFPEGEYVGIRKQIDILAEATRKMTSADRQALLAKMATANELPILTALVAKARFEMEGLSVANEKYTSSSEKAAAFFERSWQGMAQSWNALSGSIARAIETIKIQIGSVISVALRPWIDTLHDVIEQLQEFVKYNEPAVAFISQLAAGLAALATAGGVILTITGALVGLGAAIALIWRSTEDWHGTIGRLIGGLTLLAAAVANNFDYLQQTAVRIIENLNEAFGDTVEGIGGLEEAIRSLTAPAVELFGLFVRTVAGVAELVSQIIALTGAFNGIPLQLLITGFTALFSARILGSAVSMVLAFTGLGRAIAAIKTAQLATVGLSLTKISASVKGLSVASVGTGLSGLLSTLSGLVGGKVGLVALGATVAYLAYEAIPPLKDWVDKITGAFRGWNSEISETVSGLGEYGPAMAAQIKAEAELAIGTSAVEAALAKASKQAQVFATDIPDLAKEYERLGQIESGVAQNLTETEKAYEANNGLLNARRIEIKGLMEAQSQGIPVEENSAAATRASTAADEANVAVLSRQIKIYESLASIKDTINAANIREGSTIRMTTEAWTENVYRLMSITNLDSVGAGIFLRQLSNLLPDNLTEPELREFYASKKGLFANLDWNKFLEAAGMVSNIGEVSSAVDNQIVKIIQGIDLSQSASELNRIMSEGIPIAAGANIFELTEDPHFSEAVHQAARNAMQYLSETMAGELEEPSISMDAATGRMKLAMTTAMAGLFQNAFPDAGDFASRMQNLAFDQNWTALSQELMAKMLPDGRSLIEALESGEGLGSFAQATIEFMKLLVENGVASPEVIAAVEEFSETAGAEVAAASRLGLIDGFVEAFESTKFDAAALRKLKKLGSPAEMLQRAWQNAMKARRVGYGKNQNFASRGGADEVFNSFISTYDKGIARTRDGSKGQKRLDAAFLDMMTPKFNALPPRQQQKIITRIENIAGDFPGLVTRALKGKPSIVSMMMGGIGDTETLSDGGGGKGKATGGALETGLIATISTAVNNAPKAAAVAVAQAASGKAIVDPIVASVQSALDASSAGSAMTNFINRSVADSIGGADAAGANVGASWASGFARGVESQSKVITASFTVATKDGEGESPPKTGPLHRIDKWGYNVGAAWGENYAKGAVDKAVEMGRGIRAMQISNMSDIGGSAELINTNKREVRVRLEVSSPDGTVNRQKQDEMKRGAMEALTLAGLEHYVTIG